MNRGQMPGMQGARSHRRRGGCRGEGGGAADIGGPAEASAHVSNQKPPMPGSHRSPRRAGDKSLTFAWCQTWGSLLGLSWQPEQPLACPVAHPQPQEGPGCQSRLRGGGWLAVSREEGRVSESFVYLAPRCGR